MTTNEPAKHKTNADRAAERVMTLVQSAEQGATADRILMTLVGLLVVEVARLSDAINGVELELGRAVDVGRDIALHGTGQAR